jgi:hypothetical protein
MDPVDAAPPPVFLPPGTPPPPRPAPVLPIDENGIVTQDVLCRKCAYNVRGLHQNNKCPECGTPVGLSIRGNLLCYSDPAWVDKLSRGVELILWGLLAALVGSVAGAVVVMALGRRAQILAQIIGVGASVVGFIGAWLLTSPDPGTEEPSQMVNARKIVRFALVFAMAENLLSIASTGEHVHPMISAIFGIGLLIAALIGVVGEIARLYYLEKLALRIPDQALAKRAHIVRWGYGISLGIAGVFGAVMGLVTLTLKQSPQVSWMPVMMVGGCVTGLAGLTAFGFMIVYIVMLFQFRKTLKLQSFFARQMWATATAPVSMAPPAIEVQTPTVQ